MDNRNLTIYTATCLSLCFACALAQDTRYRYTNTPDGKMVYEPVNKYDVTGDGQVNESDLIDLKLHIAYPTTQPIPPPVTTQPVPPTPTNCEITVGPSDDWNAAIANAPAKATICFRGGDYRSQGDGWNFGACLTVARGDITCRNVPGEIPVFHGDWPLIFACKIGFIPNDRDKSTGVHDIVLDGLRFTGAPWNGLLIEKSWNIVVRNCWAYANNFGSTNGYKAAIEITHGGTCHDITVDHCRLFDSGIGITVGVDLAGVASPTGIDGIIIKDNFVFANSRSANLGNSSGIELWFCNRAVVSGNIIYDNPDSGINGEGNNLCRFANNICVNNWQPGGNNEGGKICVRGGGANIVAGNLFASNGNCGWDSASGVGDLLVGNTLYGNGSWGILAEGRETMLFNNLISGNSVVKADNAYPEQDASGWSLISDWNRWGRMPILGQDGSTLTTLSSNSSTGSVSLPGVSMPRSDPRQINTPETLWGVSTVEAARAIILSKYKPGTAIPGTTLANVSAIANANIPKILTALESAVAAAAASPDFQMKQATARWQQLKTQLKSYDLAGLPDNGVIGAVK